jgi:xanthine dehydrogenase FAD-binding subunit
MRRVHFHRASTLDGALQLKAGLGPEARFIAGGTDLMVDLRSQSPSLSPITVIDIGGLSEPRGIGLGSASPGGADTLRIGSLVTHAEAAVHPLLREHMPLLASAAAEVGSPQIRHRGTLGGNICHAAPCADTLPPLLALEADLILCSVRGRRTVPLHEAILGPYQTVMTDDELLLEIRVQVPEAGSRSAFIKLGRRKALSVSRMTMAVILAADAAGRVRRVRIAAGSILPTPRRFPQVEDLLSGRRISPEIAAEAGRELAAIMIRENGRRWSTPYKEPVSAALLRRALTRVMP